MNKSIYIINGLNHLNYITLIINLCKIMHCTLNERFINTNNYKKFDLPIYRHYKSIIGGHSE